MIDQDTLGFVGIVVAVADTTTFMLWVKAMKKTFDTNNLLWPRPGPDEPVTVREGRILWPFLAGALTVTLICNSFLLAYIVARLY